MKPNNINAPILDVKHAELKKSGDRPWRRQCPACISGFLLVSRDPSDGYKLKAVDRCVGCGQAVHYVDIAAMRKNDTSQIKAKG
jgi:hypothetical protein